MSTKLYNLLILLFLFSFISCIEDTNEEEPPAYEINILPIGDSRVQGNRPNHESYRFELWKNFMDNNWTVNFIGPNIDTSEYPTIDGEEFDNEHAAIGGSTTKSTLSRLQEILDHSEMPDVILLGIGGVDLLQETSVEDAIINIHAIIDILQNHNPEITIFMEQIAPGKSYLYTDENLAIFNNFNESIMTVATERNTEDSQVVAIDMATGWYDVLLADDVHYNSLGAKVVADKYFSAIDLNIER